MFCRYLSIFFLDCVYYIIYIYIYLYIFTFFDVALKGIKKKFRKKKYSMGKGYKNGAMLHGGFEGTGA